ncbi:MAG: ABC transporter ATP-binding protein [Gammaproteobacteria bacterium RIFCSPLOWO2_02_FULL_38_11]|nr:MAG: ABC transporter ATP-binding protein [Gammaproteobacteria bacterium RIFCSPLOWO2_02_FULL_38_11]OGT76790.1 MAG: ABC transporter ATP-binding protein [Gammaproteobacteria bacterium RIFCSPLOWO2_12_FULL_38_14]
MNEHIIEFKNVTTVLGNQIIHDKINLNFRKGEIISIIGGSGSGKSTLVREILGLLQPYRGKVSVFAYDMAHITEQHYLELSKKWGILFQSGALFSSLTVLENIMYPLHEYSVLPQNALEELALLKLLLVGLPKSAAIKYPSELSGGMLKRAALARALILDPHLLLLDEPTSGLDPESVTSLDELILNLRNLLNLTIIMVTHNVRTLWHITDSVVFLGEKRVLDFGKVAKVATNPHPMIHNYFYGPENIEKSNGH